VSTGALNWITKNKQTGWTHKSFIHSFAEDFSWIATIDTHFKMKYNARLNSLTLPGNWMTDKNFNAAPEKIKRSV
jgi:hypothetical protein